VFGPSFAGGRDPRWRRDGRELFYVDRSGTMTAVPVNGSGAAFVAGSPQPLFRSDIVPPGGGGVSRYEVTPDGKRFIVE
jgi:hypothetical protein